MPLQNGPIQTKPPTVLAGGFSMRKNLKFPLDFLCAQYYNKCAYKKGGAYMSPSQGRPRIDNPKTERLFIRVTPQEKAEIQSFMKECGCTLLALIKKGIEAMKEK